MGLSHSSWTPVECGPLFENVGAFCSDFISNDKRTYGSKQFEVFGLHFEVFGPGRPGETRESHYLDQGGPILGGCVFIMTGLPIINLKKIKKYMKIHVPSMLAKGVKTINKQAATMA